MPAVRIGAPFRIRPMPTTSGGRSAASRWSCSI